MNLEKMVYWILQVTEVCLWYCLLFSEMTDRHTKRGVRARLWTAVLLWAGLYGYQGTVDALSFSFVCQSLLWAAVPFAVFDGAHFLLGSLWGFAGCCTVSMIRLAAFLGRGLFLGDKMRKLMAERSGWLMCAVELCLIGLLLACIRSAKKRRAPMERFCEKSWPFLLAGGIVECALFAYTIQSQPWNQEISHVLLTLNLCAAAFTVCGLTALVFWYLNGQAKEERSMDLMRSRLVSEQYASIKEENKKFASLVHEINRERQYLCHCLKSGDAGKALAYLEEKEQQPQRQGQTWTGCGLLDHLINTRKQKMDEEGIAFSLDAAFVEIPIAEEDFWILLGNLLDNAREAAALCEAGRRRVRLEFFTVNDTFRLFVENTSSRSPVVKNGRFCSTKEGFGHGWGTENVRMVVEKYGGSLRYEYTEQRFAAEVLLYRQGGEASEPRRDKRKML